MSYQKNYKNNKNECEIERERERESGLYVYFKW